MPSISIVLPTYNRARTLARAVNSVLQQSFEDFELIIVDDGSSDHTDEVLSIWADSRIRVICLDSNQGAAVARNRGIAESTCDLIAFQDSDD